MFCFTLVIGEAPQKGLRISMEEERPVPVLTLGGPTGITIPVEENWFKAMVDLDRRLLEIPELRSRTFGLPLLLNTDFEGDTAENTVLISRPGYEKDNRALVRLVPPEGEKVTYSGSYRIEQMDSRGRVVTRFPKLEDVVGIEVIATHESEALVILHPGAAFRAVRRGKTHAYRLLPRPRIIEIQPTPGKSRGRHQGQPSETPEQLTREG